LLEKTRFHGVFTMCVIKRSENFKFSSNVPEGFTLFLRMFGEHSSTIHDFQLESLKGRETKEKWPFLVEVMGIGGQEALLCQM